MGKILIIDDEKQILALLMRIVGLEGYEAAGASDWKEAEKQLEKFAPDVVLCDVFMPDGNGVELIPRIKRLCPAAEVILLTAHGNIPDGVQAIKNGAFDYITKGDDNARILPLLARASEQAQQTKRRLQGDAGKDNADAFAPVLGRSEAVSEVIGMARKVAATDVPVLLTGETGTGKEVFSRAIHRSGQRASGPFVAVNCSAFGKDLLESEMFGYKAGAFTGAVKDKPGLFEAAHRGTLFLDEIGEMAPDLQAKLLRVLETGEWIRVGDTQPVRADVRIIAATNRDLQEEIAAGRFREDLFYRLSVFRLHLPPLRERLADLELLVRAFVDLFAGKTGKKITAIDAGFMDALKRHPWKGNIRELRNVIERSLILTDGDTLLPEVLPRDMQAGDCSATEGSDAYSGFDLSSVERLHIRKVLQYTGGNKTEASRLLGIGLTTLYRKIEEYGL